jgi:hypothetical protein
MLLLELNDFILESIIQGPIPSMSVPFHKVFHIYLKLHISKIVTYIFGIAHCHMFEKNKKITKIIYLIYLIHIQRIKFMSFYVRTSFMPRCFMYNFL